MHYLIIAADEVAFSECMHIISLYKSAQVYYAVNSQTDKLATYRKIQQKYPFSKPLMLEDLEHVKIRWDIIIQK